MTGSFLLLLVSSPNALKFSPPSHTVYTPPPSGLSQIFRASLAQTTVFFPQPVISLLRNPPPSRTSSTWHILLPGLGNGAAWCLSVFPLSMITTNRSQLGFVHGFSLPSDVVLGDDRVRPFIMEDPSVIRWPCPLLLDGFSSPHSGSQV